MALRQKVPEIMKVLFSDTDGVMNRFRSSTEDKANAIGQITAPELVRRVLTIRQWTHCKIVCTSSWRRFEANLTKLLQLGVIIDKDDVTPYFNTPTRGEEIAAYLASHPEVTSYAILDDHANMLESQLPRFVHTISSAGINMNQMRQCIDILNEGI